MAAMPSDRSTDTATLIAIAAICGVLATQIHEAGGHGGACLATGLQPRAWGAFYFDCKFTGAPVAAVRIVAAAGSVMNVALAAVAALLFRGVAKERHGLRFFLWLTATLNAFTFAGYFMFSGIGGVGDWGGEGVLIGVTPLLPWRIAMAVGGLAAYWTLAWAAMRTLGAMTGGDPAGRKQARRLATISYVTIGVVAVLVGLLNPEGLFVLLASAVASSFGGASGLLWGQTMLPRDGHYALFALNWDRRWIAAAVVLVGLEAIVLGPTLTF